MAFAVALPWGVMIVRGHVVLVALALVASGCTPRPAATEERGDAAKALAAPSSPTLASKVIPLAPAEAPATCLVVLLHGVGADAESFQGIGRALAGDVPRCEMLVPDGFHPFDRAETGRQWYSMAGVTEANRAPRVREAGIEVSGWIDSELARRKLSGDRLAVVGFSQGAMVASWLAVHRGVRPFAVVMLSGRVSDDEAPTKGAPVPVLVAHGDADAVVPVSVVEPGERVLTAWGARVTTPVYPGLAPPLTPQELREAGAFLKRAQP